MMPAEKVGVHGWECRGHAANRAKVRSFSPYTICMGTGRLSWLALAATLLLIPSLLFSQSLSCCGLRSAFSLAFSRHAVDQAPHASRSCDHCHNPLCIPAPVDDASASYYRPSHSCCHQGLLTEDFGVPASEKADSSPTAKNGQAFMPVVERIARISAIPNPGGETGSPPLFLKNRSLLL